MAGCAPGGLCPRPERRTLASFPAVVPLVDRTAVAACQEITMTTPTLVATLAKHPFVQGLSPAQVEKLASLAKAERFEPNRIVFREGDESSEFYLIVSGKVALEMASHGDAFRVETVSGGDELGWSSVLTGKGKFFQARTLEPVDVLAFDGNELRAVFERDPAFGYAFMFRLIGVVSDRLQSTRLQVLDMYSPVAKRAGT
jgi:CRP/FNR family cyclic AMP-dependent transcriptional regulator